MSTPRRREKASEELRALARSQKQDPERWISEARRINRESFYDYVSACEEVKRTFGLTGQPEPIAEPRCINCRGTKYSPNSGCRMRFHGGDVFGWERVVVRESHTCQGCGEVGDQYCVCEGDPQKTSSELWRCRECGEVPEHYDSEKGRGRWVFCRCNSKHNPEVFGKSPSLAREEWNERYGKEPEGESCHEECQPPLHNKMCPVVNPHGLTLCACGSIPQVVAFRDEVCWGWAVECPSHLHATWGYERQGAAIKDWWLGTRQQLVGVQERRYDLPTDLILGCEELPEEYR